MSARSKQTARTASNATWTCLGLIVVMAIDQVIETELVIIQVRLDLLRRAPGRGRADGLVRFLGVAHARLVLRRLRRQKSAAEFFADIGARFVLRRGGHVHRIGAHIGDQADLPFADVHAFIERLRRGHGALGGKAEPPVSVLLQGAGGEWRSGKTATLPGFH